MRRPPFDYALIEEYADERPTSRLAYARFLHDIDPNRSVKGWEMAIMRWEGRAVPSERVEEVIEEVREDYTYDSVLDIYHTYLESAQETISLEGDIHRGMLDAYSDKIGKALTKAEICLRYEFPQSWFGEYARKHGWTHTSIPFTNEIINSTSTEELTEKLLQKKKASIVKDAEKAEIVQIKKDADSFRNFRTTILDDLLKLVSAAPSKTPKLKLKAAQRRYALVISPTDFHWGKYGWVDEVGETYNFDTARERLFSKTEELAARIPGQPDKIILAAGSDWFHVDNDNSMTTRGTPQDSCGSPAEILMTGCRLAREHIELLRQIAPVDVTFMPGNHDRHSTYALMMYLSAVYENSNDVSVIVSPKTRQYLSYGDTLLGFTHGDAVRGNKLPTLMASEAREDWGTHRWHIWFHGHLHHQSLIETDGCTVIQLPSLAGHDRYHYRHGYTQNAAGLAAHIIDYEEGLVGSLFSPVLVE